MTVEGDTEQCHAQRVEYVDERAVFARRAPDCGQDNGYQHHYINDHTRVKAQPDGVDKE